MCRSIIYYISYKAYNDKPSECIGYSNSTMSKDTNYNTLISVVNDEIAWMD